MAKNAGLSWPQYWKKISKHFRICLYRTIEHPCIFLSKFIFSRTGEVILLPSNQAWLCRAKVTWRPLGLGLTRHRLRGSDPSTSVFVNSVLSGTGIDATQGTPLSTSASRLYTKLWTVSGKPFDLYTFK